MPHIRIERTHTLGLPRARHVAQEWMAEARERWGLRFDLEASERGGAASAIVDRIRFSGMGAEGSAEVSARRFVVALELKGLLSLLASSIEAKMAGKLDALLAQESTQKKRVPRKRRRAADS